MAATVHDRVIALSENVAQLRLLIELPALRKLADRGLSDQELALVRQLAHATMRAARSGDVVGYLRADMVFHLCLLELTGDPVVSGIARLMLAPDRISVPGTEVSAHLMVRRASEHAELAGMLGDGMVSAAGNLLRLHLAGRSAGREAPVHVAEAEPDGAGGTRQ
jgi:DNA-binding GntR family transcriptional regulator